MLDLALESAILASELQGGGITADDVAALALGGMGRGRTSLHLTLWRSDLMSGMLQVDNRRGTIVHSTDSVLHQPGGVGDGVGRWEGWGAQEWGLVW